METNMIKPQEYAARRQRLMKAMGENAIGIVVAAPEVLRNGDAHYDYRQNSDFYYLTGFSEPEAVAVFIPGRAEGEYLLFNRPRDPQMEVWIGPRAGQEGAVKKFGANQSFAISQLDEELPKLLENRQKVFFAVGRDLEFNNRLLGWLAKVQTKIRAGINAPAEFYNIEQIVHEMRLFKSPDEVAVMRQAGKISAAAHCSAMQVCHPGIKEYQLQAQVEYVFKQQGSHAQAYSSIVGAGNNACVLHYIDNCDTAQDGDLVLIDAGAEYEYYAADITRTFPVNGKFSEAQRAIYEIVLKAQMAVIEQIKPGIPWIRLQEISEQVITDGLIEVGLLKGKKEELLRQQAFKKFYMHRIGHWLGLDVHDVGQYRVNGQWRLLEPGMVFTVEPGIYIPANSEDIDKKWWNIGVRIEDNVLVTNNGYEVLTADVPKTVAEIEALMAQKIA